jgi:hypothetical protein
MIGPAPCKKLQLFGGLLLALVLIVVYSNNAHSNVLSAPPDQVAPIDAIDKNNEILIFFQDIGDDQAKFRLLLEKQLKLKMPGHAFRFVDLSSKEKRDLAVEFQLASHCVMAIGPDATQKMLTLRKPGIYYSLQTSRLLLDKLHRIYKPLNVEVSGIYQEQPLARQIYLAKALSPDLTSIRVLLDQKDKYYLNEYQDLARSQGLSLDYQILRAADSPEKYLGPTETESDYLLLTNNNQLYMKSKLAALVLTAYYQRIRLIGSRLEDVQTGTLASIYTPLTTLAIEASNDFKDMCQSRQIAPPRYAKSFSVAINRQIAENLGLTNIDANQLSKQITSMDNSR